MTETIEKSSIPGASFRRILRGLCATAVSPVLNAIIQLGTVPWLLHAWGSAKYGDWLILYAIPSYLSLSNLGFGNASGSDMTVRVAAGDRNGALETFQSSWALVMLVSVFVLLLSSTAVWWIPWHRWLNLSTLSDGQASAVLLVLVLYILVGQQSGILESGFRCDGNFATGSIGGTAMWFTEAICGTMVGAVSGSLLFGALGYLIVRVILAFTYGLILYRKSPWLSLGFQHARMARLKELAIPALGFIALPLAYAIGIQGFTLLIASLKGAESVTEFSTMRTLARTNFQLMTVIAWAMWPELSRAFGEGNIPLARAIHRYAYQAGVALSAIAGMLLWFAGPLIYRIWTHHALPFDPGCFHMLVLVTFANSLWFTSSVVPMSTNAHHRITLAFVAVSLISLGLAWALLERLGLRGAAYAMLFIDGSMFWMVLRTALRQLGDRTIDFIRALLRPPRLFSFNRAVSRSSI